MVAAERSLTRRGGGQVLLFQNLFWFYSHPAVYIMVLPAMGVVSEIIPVFSRKPLFGYRSFVVATVGIGVLGLLGVVAPYVHDGWGVHSVLHGVNVPHCDSDGREDV